MLVNTTNNFVSKRLTITKMIVVFIKKAEAVVNAAVEDDYGAIERERKGNTCVK